jgi:hypothetical protein
MDHRLTSVLWLCLLGALLFACSSEGVAPPTGDPPAVSASAARASGPSAGRFALERAKLLGRMSGDQR